MSEDFQTPNFFKIFLEERYKFCKNNKLPPKKVVISQDIYFDFMFSFHFLTNSIYPIKSIEGIPYEVLEDNNVENYIKFE